MTLVEPGSRHVAEDEVLLPGEAHVAAVRLGQLGDGGERGSGHPPGRHRDTEVEQPLLALRMHAQMVELGARLRRYTVLERPAELLLDLRAHAVRAVVVHHELDARLGPRDAVAQVALPGVGDRRECLDGLFARDEHAEIARDPRGVGHTPADAQREALPAVLGRGDQGDVGDLQRVALRAARRDRVLVLARQVGELRVAVEVLGDLADHRRDVERLVVGQPRDGAAGDVADGVALGPRRGQAGCLDGGQHLGQLGQFDPVQLDALAGRQLRLVTAVVARDPGQRAAAARW